MVLPMVDHDHHKNEETLITLSDLFLIIRRSRKMIVGIAIFCACLAITYALSRPITYEIEATFREKEKSNAGISSSLFDLFRRGGGKHGGIAIMRSRRLMEDVTKKLSLQVTIGKKQAGRGSWGRIKDNLTVQHAHRKNKKIPVLADIEHDLHCKEVHYPGEVPINLTLYFESEDIFTVSGLSDDKTLGLGALDKPFSHANFSFTLTKNDGAVLSGQTYTLAISPLIQVAKGLAHSLAVEADENDKDLLRLGYRHRDRHFGAQFVNTVMTCYQDYLKAQSNRTAETQLAYLRKRREETKKELEEVMNQHAMALTSGITSSGFINSEKQMEFLAKSQLEGRQKLMGNSIELKHLQNLKDTGEYVLYDRYSPTGDPEVINRVLSEIRSLKQQRDSLEVALGKYIPDEENELRTLFSQQFADQSEIQQALAEIDLLLKTFEKQQDGPLPPLKVLDRPNILVKLWYDKLKESQRKWEQATGKLRRDKKENWSQQRTQFIDYLKNLTRVFNVRLKIIRQRLAHHQNPHLEFDGIDLNTAKDLYLRYTKEWDEAEGLIRQHRFIIDQLGNPDFEITALSAILNDPISQGIINQASKLVLEIRDEENRSQREKERLQARIALQTQFLIAHLHQATDLMILRQGMLNDKLHALQNLSLDLIHQQISILEKNLDDYLTTRIENIKQERELITAHLNELQQEMAVLPKQWVTEQLVQEQLHHSRDIVQGVAELVEAKNLSHNLELIQSMPFDLAYPPILPRSPNILKFGIIGAILGAFFTTAFAFARSLMTGLIATANNLTIAGQHVCGTVSPHTHKDGCSILHDSDLNTLRRLLNTVIPGRESNLLLLIQNEGPDYSHHLATLMAKKGLKVLCMPLTFEGKQQQEGTVTLLDVLEGTNEMPTVVQQSCYDTLIPGGPSRYGNELTSSPTFNKLLQQLKQSYNWIIITTPAKPTDPQAETLIPTADAISVTVQQEQGIDELRPYFIHKNEKKTAKSTFVFVD